MKINDTRTKPETVKFNELPLGQIFEADDGVICIKISNQYKDGVPNILMYFSGEWETGYEYTGSEVVPLNAEIIIS